MSQAQFEEKVADYLRNSQALEDYWQRPITAEQLQAEMERMAKQTKQPEVLRELFEVLGNDPFVIAECLARPALSERLATTWYAYDQRMHGELKQRADADLGKKIGVRAKSIDTNSDSGAFFGMAAEAGSDWGCIGVKAAAAQPKWQRSWGSVRRCSIVGRTRNACLTHQKPDASRSAAWKN